MDLFRRAQQTDGKLFFKFEFVFELMAENRKYSNEYRGVDFDQSAMCNISIDSF